MNATEPKEDVGFEPTHAFTRLTVFKTVPFSQTWVILRTTKIVYHLFFNITTIKQKGNVFNTNFNEIKKALTEVRVDFNNLKFDQHKSS